MGDFFLKPFSACLWLVYFKNLLIFICRFCILQHYWNNCVLNVLRKGSGCVPTDVFQKRRDGHNFLEESETGASWTNISGKVSCCQIMRHCEMPGMCKLFCVYIIFLHTSGISWGRFIITLAIGEEFMKKEKRSWWVFIKANTTQGKVLN